MDPIIRSGARIVFLNRGVFPIELADDWIVEIMTVTPTHAGWDGDSSEFTYLARNLRPYAPAHLKAEPSGSGWQVSWVRRPRFDGDSWAGAEVPQGETVERYRVEIVVGNTITNTSETIVPKTTLIAPSGAIIRVSQQSARFGWGAAAEITVP